MSFLIKNKKLLRKYNQIQEKVSTIVKKIFDNEPVYNENYLKTKLIFLKGSQYKFA